MELMKSLCICCNQFGFPRIACLERNQKRPCVLKWLLPLKVSIDGDTLRTGSDCTFPTPASSVIFVQVQNLVFVHAEPSYQFQPSTPLLSRHRDILGVAGRGLCSGNHSKGALCRCKLSYNSSLVCLQVIAWIHCLPCMFAD